MLASLELLSACPAFSPSRRHKRTCGFYRHFGRGAAVCHEIALDDSDAQHGGPKRQAGPAPGEFAGHLAHLRRSQLSHVVQRHEWAIDRG